MPNTITVSADPSADTMFHSVSDALASIPAENKAPVTVLLAPGVYQEKVTVDRPYVTLAGTGSSNNDTVIRYDDYALFLMEDGKKRGTFRSYTMFIDAHDVTLHNLTIENASGDSKTHGQAIALYADGDRLFIDTCRLLGHQDTLFTGPLPPTEKEPGGFIGPKQFAPRINGRQYYRNCYICGDVDFIFGSATAYFENCTLESLRRLPEADAVQGYVTAASTPEGQEYGYVFSGCHLISRDCPAGSVYLGRPWRDFAHTVFLNCTLGAHIHPAGFHDWGKTAAHETIFYAEYPGAPTPSARADFVHTLSAGESAHYSKEAVLSGDDGWNP